MTYELEFVSGEIEYEFEIDAENGNILDFEKETVHNQGYMFQQPQRLRGCWICKFKESKVVVGVSFCQSDLDSRSGKYAKTFL